MQLKDCHIGQIIKHSNGQKRIGHIVDLEVNSLKEVILVVKWADSDLCANNPYSIHPANVQPLQ